MKRPVVMMIIAAAVLSSPGAIAAAVRETTVEVYKTPTCGCCTKWVEHLQAHGFTVRSKHLQDLTELKTKHHVPQRLQSCHTGVVNGYVLEGHVPAPDVRRLLKERPAVAGLAVPGMPTGSPGMEVPGSRQKPYDVIAFKTDGTTQVFSSHGR